MSFWTPVYKSENPKELEVVSLLLRQHKIQCLIDSHLSIIHGQSYNTQPFLICLAVPQKRYFQAMILIEKYSKRNVFKSILKSIFWFLQSREL